MDTNVKLGGDFGQRRYDLDWVRILAFGLLILYHVGMYYVTWDWHVKSARASAAIEPLMFLTSPWRLSLLFVVSGVATAYLLARPGQGSFLGQRSIRLLVPLLFGMFVIVPPQSYLEVVEKLGYAGSYPEFLRLYVTRYHGFCKGDDCLSIPTWNHLWFVAYLWVYTVVIYALARLAPTFITALRRRAERHLAGLALLAAPVAYFAVVRIGLVARFPANHGLVGDWYNHALYFPMFTLGFVLAGTRAPWAVFERARWVTLGLAVLGWAYLCAYFGTYTDAVAPPAELVRVFQRALYGAEQWLAIAAALGFARRHLAIDSAARRYLTTAIFPVYILHQTVIVVTAHALKPAALDPSVEGFLLVLVTAAASFLGYEAIRRIAVLRPLFGLPRAEPPSRALAASLPASSA